MIGYYIHHHGKGHLVRAQNVAAALSSWGVPVVALSSLPQPDEHAFVDWVALDRDDADGTPTDRRAGGALHWAPTDSHGYRRRMARLSAWVASTRPALVIVDVSVEVTSLVRLLGVPVVVVAGPGTRVDPPHQLAYRLATHIVAPWPRAVYEPGYLMDASGADDFAAKTTYTGAFSRFDDREPAPPPGRRTVLALFGAGGSDVSTEALAAASGASTGWVWRTVGGAAGEWTDDVWTAMQQADVVVTHAGLSALAEVAAARRAAVVVPQTRPFDEQHATGQALRAAGLATVLDAWPPAEQWSAILADAVARGGEQWSRWNDGQGALRFAELLNELLGDCHRAA